MKKIVLSVILLLLFQGCSRLPLLHNKKMSVQIPAVSTSPSALVCVDGKASVLELDGTLTDITPMSIADRFSCVYHNASKTYFILQNMFFNCSLWVYDREIKTLTCLAPTIPQSGKRHLIDNFTVTEGEDYLLYQDDVYPLFKPFSLNEKEYKLLYSIKKQQPIKIPSFEGQTLVELRQHQNVDQFLMFTTDEHKMFVYRWDILQKKTELIAQFESFSYSISRDGKWLVTFYENALNRYSLLDGKKEILLNDKSISNFSFVGNQSTLLVCRYGNPSETIVSTMSADKQWKAKILGDGNYVGYFTEINPSIVYFKAFNKTSGENKIILWCPDQDVFDIVFQSKTVEIETTYEISENRGFLNIQGYQKPVGMCSLFVDVEKKTASLVKGLYVHDLKEASNDNSIWFYHEFTQPDKTKENSFQIKYFVYNSNNNQTKQLEYITNDLTYETYANNNGDYIYIHLDDKDRLFDIQNGQEINVPGLTKKYKTFTFITWLD